MIKLTNDIGGKPIWINADRVMAVTEGYGYTSITTTNGIFTVTDKPEKVITLIRDWHAF